MSLHSQQRLEARILKAVNTMIVSGELKNLPPSSFASVSRVDLSKDNAYATIHISCLKADDEKELARAVDALQRSAGFVQARLGAVLRTRNTPRLTFKPDTSLAEGQKVVDLIDSLGLSDG